MEQELNPWQGAPEWAAGGEKGGCGPKEGVEQAGTWINVTGMAQSWDAELGWCCK